MPECQADLAKPGQGSVVAASRGGTALRWRGRCGGTPRPNVSSDVTPRRAARRHSDRRTAQRTAQRIAAEYSKNCVDDSVPATPREPRAPHHGPAAPPLSTFVSLYLPASLLVLFLSLSVLPGSAGLAWR